MENWNNDTNIYNTDKEVNLEEASKGKSWIFNLRSSRLKMA